MNRVLLADLIGAPLGASPGFEQDTGCINILDFDLVPLERGQGTKVEPGVIKAVNLTRKRGETPGRCVGSTQFVPDRFHGDANRAHVEGCRWISITCPTLT